MSAIIIGGNECMGRTYRDLCAKYNITVRYPPQKGQLRQPTGESGLHIRLYGHRFASIGHQCAKGSKKAWRAAGQTAPRQRVRAGA